MTLNTIIDQLKYGELRSIAAKNDNFAITSYVNLALQALYNRFNLKSSSQEVVIQEGTTEYTLNENLMTIYKILDSLGNELPLDDDTNPDSILQLDFQTIYIPKTVTIDKIVVVYSPAPSFLTYVDETSLISTIPLPPQLLEPLLHYIGYRAHGSMNGDIKAENNTHYMRFVASCDRIDKLGIIRKAIPSSVKLNELMQKSLKNI